MELYCEKHDEDAGSTPEKLRLQLTDSSTSQLAFQYIGHLVKDKPRSYSPNKVNGDSHKLETINISQVFQVHDQKHHKLINSKGVSVGDLAQLGIKEMRGSNPSQAIWKKGVPPPPFSKALTMSINLGGPYLTILFTQKRAENSTKLLLT